MGYCNVHGAFQDGVSQCCPQCDYETEQRILRSKREADRKSRTLNLEFHRPHKREWQLTDKEHIIVLTKNKGVFSGIYDKEGKVLVIDEIETHIPRRMIFAWAQFWPNQLDVKLPEVS